MEALAAYRSNTGTSTTSSLKTRSWDRSGWAAEAEQATAGSPLRAVRMAWSPTSPATRIIVTQSDDGFLDAYVCTPSCTVTNNIDQVWSAAPSTPQKRFDVAYEQLSGEALLVYGVLSTSTTCDIAYKTYISGTWSAQNCLDDTGHAADIQYAEIDLAPKKGSDQIGLIGADVTDNDANAWIWDGSAWGSNNEITAAMKAPSEEEVAIAWESSSGNLLAGAVDSATPANVVFKEYTTGWSGALTATCGASGASIRWLALTPNPLSTANDMILGCIDTSWNMATNYWTGSAWNARVTHTTGIDVQDRRPFDFAWELTGNKGLLVYGDFAGQITYKTFTAPSTWGSATNLAMGANSHTWIKLATNPAPRLGDAKIVGAVLEDIANDLGAIKRDGTTFTMIGSTTFSADTATNIYDAFAIGYASENNQLLIRYDWTGVPSGDAYTLKVKGYREDENINVQVLTPPSTWNTRMVISATTNTLYTYAMTSAEYNSGSPAIRFTDANDMTGQQSDLFVDFAAVATVDGNGRATSVSTGGPVAIRATVSAVTGSAQLSVNTSPIVVNWPSLATVPGKYDLFLTDLDSQKTINLRTNGGYTVPASRAAGTR